MNVPPGRWRGTVASALADAVQPALVEATWILLLSLSLESALKTPVALPWPLLAVISLINLAVARLPGTGDSSADRAVRVGIGLASIALLTGWPFSAPRLLVALLLVWRARTLADITLPEERLRVTVRAGSGGLATALVLRSLSGITTVAVSQAEAVTVTAFVVLALWSLASAQRMELAAEYELSTGVERSYVVPIVAILVIVLGCGVLLVLFPPLMAIARTFLGLMMHLAGFLFVPAIETVVYLLFTYLLEPLAAYLQGRFGTGTRITPLGGLIDQLRAERSLTSSEAPPFLHTFLVGLVAVVVFLVILAVALRLAAGLRPSDDTRELSTDRRTSLWTWTWLPAWLRRLRRAGTDVLARVRDDAVELVRGRSVPMTAEGVYREVVRMSATGTFPPEVNIMPRQPQQTPFEYCRELARSLPTVAPDLLLVAGWYVDVRYGGEESPAQERLRPVAKRLFAALDDARRRDGV